MDGREFDVAFLKHLLQSRLFLKKDAMWPAANKQALQGLIHSDYLKKSAAVEAVRTAPSPQMVATIHGVDVLVICALAKEQKAALAAFDIQPSRTEDDNIDGHKIFFSEIEIHSGSLKKLAIASVNKQRNVNMALVTQHLIARFHPSDAFLCGITASRPDKTNFCDVFPSMRIWDIAGGREEPGRVGRRDEPFTPPIPMSNYLDYFDPKPDFWKRHVQASLNDARRFAELSFMSDADVASLELKVTRGIYFVDETLMADGDWQKLVERDERAVAREMESSGFAQACGIKVGWLVFKACSDYGDQSKHDDWHQTAAFISALAVKLFLQTEYRSSAQQPPF